MSIKLASVELNTPNTIGNQDFTVSGFGTADAAIFLTSFGTAAGSQQAAIQASIGFAANNGTTTTQHVSAATVQNNVATSNTYRRYATDEVCMRVDTSGSLRAEGAWNSWITDGVRVDWHDPDNQTTRKVVAILIQDTDASAKFYVGQFTPNATEDASVDVTDIDAQADLVIFTGSYTSSVDTTADGAKLFLGIWERSSGLQYSLSWYSEDAAAAEQVGSFLSNLRCGVEVAEAGVGAGLECVENVDGFRVFTRDASGASFGVVGYLAINFTTRHQMQLGVYRVPTGTGTDATTGVGFQPDFLLGIQSHITALNTLTQDSTGGVFGVGFSDLSSEDSASFECEDAADPTDTNSVWNSVFHHTVRGDTDGDQIGTVSAVGADGFTINWTSAVVASQGIGVYLAITNDVKFSPDAATLTLAGESPTISAAATLAAGDAGLTLSGEDPTIEAAGTLAAGDANLTLSGEDPTIAAAATLTQSEMRLSLSAESPTLAAAATLSAGVVSLTLAGEDPVIAAAAELVAEDANLFLTGRPATIMAAAPGDQELSPGVATLTLAGEDPAITAAAFIRPNRPILTFTPQTPALSTVTGDTVLQPASAGLTLTAFSPTLEGPVTAATRAPGHTRLSSAHLGRAQLSTR